jgi:hypothetical protein
MLCSKKNPSLETTKKAVIVMLNPTASVSKISSTGKFNIHFSDAMNLESLIKTKARRLRGKSGGSTKSTLNFLDLASNSSSSAKTEYLLSAKHLRIQMIQGPEFNSTLFKFKWEVLSLTETDIEIQILFDYPLSISNEAE